MKHLGDITKIDGREVPPVNVIIGGSPCQDLSVAGKREGLQGKRSGLFMEQIRIIKEMRQKDAESGRTCADIRPRFMVWENVPGAFSVNGGRDFAAVLEETIRVVEQEAPDILPPTDGWTNSGCFLGRGWSVAWRVLDAQFWGVPHRRRRIALVADFGGECAPEILFEREGVSRDTQPNETAQKRAAGIATASARRSGGTVEGTMWDGDDIAPTLTKNNANGAQRMPDKQNFNAVVIGVNVRRLTPLECTRLQGFPDGWVDIGDWTDSKGKLHKESDSMKYRALGNSIAIPPWLWVLSRLNVYCEEKTMASLFDGIGGFPLIWEHLNGHGSAVWASEIEEFPIAVTKRRFPE